ncbi:MAG: hypothetical protein HUJ30_02820 [Gammaproteobacteria bacterium]|nr:hypothetical protein [Gammaproteobacteria bacterium]
MKPQPLYLLIGFLIFVLGLQPAISSTLIDLNQQCQLMDRDKDNKTKETDETGEDEEPECD